MNKVQIENSYFKDKVRLRIHAMQKKNNINVLDCFSANGKIWDHIKNKKDNININVLRIEKEKNRRNIYLKGDNLKFIGMLDLTGFDIIDLDSYGIPFSQLELIFKKKFNGIIVVTFIQSYFGCINHYLLEELGYTKSMIKKIPTLFNVNGYDKILSYLAKRKVKKIYEINRNNKHYFYFNLKTD